MDYHTVVALKNSTECVKAYNDSDSNSGLTHTLSNPIHVSGVAQVVIQWQNLA